MDIELFKGFLNDLRDIESFDNFILYSLPTLKRQQYGEMGKKIRVHRRRYNPFRDIGEEQFKLKYRFTKGNMRKVIEMIRDDLETEAPFTDAIHRKNQVPAELQIMAAIRCWGFSEPIQTIASAHGISVRTLWKICRRVSAAFASKASRYIRMPATLAEKESVTKQFHTLARMPSVIGAVTQSTVRLVQESNTNKLNCHSASQIHIQIVCDAALKIRDVHCKLGTSNGNNFVPEMFAQTRIKERFEQNEFRGRILLADNRFLCTPYLFTPVKSCTQSEEKDFNKSHTITVSPAVKCLSLWKARFNILNNELYSSFNTAKHIIISVALLHNMAVEWNDSNFDTNLLDVTYGSDYNDSDIYTNTGDTNIRQEFIKHNF